MWQYIPFPLSKSLPYFFSVSLGFFSFPLYPVLSIPLLLCLLTCLPSLPPHLLPLFSRRPFAPLRSVSIFPRRKSRSEPLLAEMMLLFENPLRVENTCSSVQRRSEGNWINRSFFPMLEMERNAHTYPQACTCTVRRAHAAIVSQKNKMRAYEQFNLAGLPAVYSPAARVQSVSNVKSTFEVKSSSVLLTPVSSLVCFIMPSEQTVGPRRKQDTAHIIGAHILLKAHVSVADYLTFHVGALLALWLPAFFFVFV